MATQQRVKRIRGTAGQNAAATLPEGNFVVKTPIDGTVWVHDGSTPGGFPIGAAAGGAFALDPVTTGVLHTVVLSALQTCTYWTSATGGAKTAVIPGAASVNKGYLWIDKTTLNNGDTHNIVPSSGTVESFTTLTFNDFRASISLISDGVSNWMIV